MVDIVPEMLEDINKTFYMLFNANATVRKLKEKVDKGTAGDQDAFLYARTVGSILQKALKHHISADKLPDGKMYYNIAERVLNDSYGLSYKEVSKYCVDTQTVKNQKIGTKVKAIKAPIDQDNIDNLINKVCTYDNYEDASFFVEAGALTFTKHIYDRNLKENADFHRRLGMQVVIIRTSDGEACPFCDGLAGTYKNDDPDVYSRHNDCNCKIITETKKR